MDHKKLVDSHCESKMPPRIKALVELATADLFYGPPYPGGYDERAEELGLENPEQYKGYDFGKCCGEIRDWAEDELPSQLWVDINTGSVEAHDPANSEWAEECAREGCPIDLSDYVYYDSADVRNAVFGCLAPYL